MSKKITNSNEDMVEDLTPGQLLKPHEIKAYLDEYIIGQDDAKKVVSVGIYNHYKKILMNSCGYSDVELDKSNILLLGSTGCGKTLIVKTIAKLLDIPCYIQDCTKITASGYVGSDVEECLVGLLRASNYDIEKAQRGIVMLDEGDKLAKIGAGPSITRDVSGECVQQSLLKIVEGDIVGVPPAGGRKHPEQPLLYVDTKNILFILSGAFSGMENIVKKRMGKNTIGLDSVADTVECDYVDNVTPQDLKEFGMIPEFIGRFPIITGVRELDKESLVKILTEPKNSIIHQYKDLLMFDNVTVDFTDDALDMIAGIAITLKTGARGLRAIVETVMTDIMFDIQALENKTIRIDSEYVKEKTGGKYSTVLKKLCAA